MIYCNTTNHSLNNAKTTEIVKMKHFTFKKRINILFVSLFFLSCNSFQIKKDLSKLNESKLELEKSLTNFEKSIKANPSIKTCEKNIALIKENTGKYIEYSEKIVSHLNQCLLDNEKKGKHLVIAYSIISFLCIGIIGFIALKIYL